MLRIGIVLLVFLLDQGSKWLILRHLSFREVVPVIPGFKLTLAYNPGVAFSLFNSKVGLIPLLLTVFVSLICISIAFWLMKTPKNDKWTSYALAFILGGALGNLYDRIAYGHVIDFIDTYIYTWHWYTFNVADSFITLGALMMFKTILFSSERENATS